MGLRGRTGWAGVGVDAGIVAFAPGWLMLVGKRIQVGRRTSPLVEHSGGTGSQDGDNNGGKLHFGGWLFLTVDKPGPSIYTWSSAV